MPIGTTNAISGPYYGDGVVVAFPFDFQVLTGDQVSVYVDGVEQDRAAFSVALAGPSPSTGTVLFAVAPPAGAAIRPVLAPSFTQDIEFADGAAWLADPVNRGYDQAALRDQALARDLRHALRLPMGDEAAVLPPADRRKGYYLGFDPATGAPALRSSSDPLSLTALGVPAGAINMGAFDGNLLSDDLTGKQVMQILASALESKDFDLVSIINDKNEIVTASIANEAIVRANAISALAAQISSISTSLGENASAIHSEVIARADAISALASQVSNFSASIGANAAAISAETTARTDAVASVAAQISSLNTNYNGLTATVSGNYTALSNAIAAQAATISSVQAQANGLSATVTAQASAIANLGSADAYWRVTAVSGDNRASIELRASAGYAGFDITGNVRISGSLLIAGSVRADNIETDGITAMQQAYNGGTFYGGAPWTEYVWNQDLGSSEPVYHPGTYNIVISYNVEMSMAGDILALAVAKQSYSGSPVEWQCTIYIDGVGVFTTGGVTASDSVSLMGRLSVGPGTHNVQFAWWSGGPTLRITPGGASLMTLRRYR
ncbi:hypothetical protein [Novosphingobium sediminicola]|uniref:DUF1983 domain-containing protein n=1 Tax=Novosphingobium sediminicola TaxID=563162 RepID=A0A7W6G6N0_9SPHN|nr:hypothetical protein [Novosphingobium sediminicola]MBB3955929.1 hypothetical protein [Novosphingobium sediminicola]